MSLSNTIKKDDSFYPGVELLPCCPNFLTKKEVAYICNISIPTVQRMIEQGLFSTDEDGKIKKADLLQYIKKNRYANKPIL